MLGQSKNNVKQNYRRSLLPFKRLPAPAWFLMLVAPFVIESCITASTPPSHWLNPVAAALLVLAYGPPILLLREVWIRCALSLRGLFLFGLMYGLMNEGILAHTITQASGEPITHFVGYDEALGIHWAWASLIVPWHAFYSVTFMVLLTHLWFPAMAGTPWLGKRGMRILVAINLLLLPLYFLIHSEMCPAPVLVFPLYLALMGLFYWLGMRAPHAASGDTSPPPRRQLLLTALVAVLIPSIITIAGFEFAHNKLPVALYFLFTLGTVWIILRCLRYIHPQRLLAFMLGGTIGLCGFSALLSRDPLYLIVAPVFLAFIATSLRKLLKQVP